jgi:hypothetical protein
MTITNGSISSFSSAGGLSINFGASGISSNTGTVCINGMQIPLTRLHEIANNTTAATTAKAAEEKQKTYFLVPGQLKSVALKGSATLHPLPVEFVSPIFSASVAGSGDIFLPNMKFTTLMVNVAGSGDVSGTGGTSAETANISLAGSGDICKIHILESGVVSLSGSGDINLTARNPAAVVKNKLGSGSVKIR